MDFLPRDRPIRSTAVSALLLSVLAGCGGGSASPLDDAARTTLRADVANIRAERGDATGVTAAVVRFRADVRRLLDDGRLAAADGRVLLAQADQIESRARADVPSPTPSPATIRSSAPASPERETKPGKPSKSKKKHGRG